MKPRYIFYLFVLTIMLFLIAIATAPLAGVQMVSATELRQFNGFSLILLATGGALLYLLLKCEHLYERNADLTERVRLQEDLTKSAQRSEYWYRKRVETLKKYADYFPEPFQTYIYNVIANGSMVALGEPRDNRENPLPTATLYREDFNDYQWYRLLVDLGAIDDYEIEHKHRETVAEILDEQDKQLFEMPDIEVLFVR